MKFARPVLSLAFVVLYALAHGARASAAAIAFPPAFIGSIDVPKTDVSPAIDGTLNDPVWKKARSVELGYNMRVHGPAAEHTTAYLLADATYLYVGVDAKQNTAVRATQHTDNVGLDTNDEFQIDLWPNGTSGFRYKFTSTPIGTHYQFSTENNAFEPLWTSAGRLVPGGFTITMRIPLGVMHGTGSGSWRVQLIRYVVDTNTPYVWSYGPQQQDFNNVTYSGDLRGLPKLAEVRGKPRLGLYALGQAASASAGGTRARGGLDLSLPLISGTSFVGTYHPDFSDVEVDQQTIAPTAFVRVFQEVRPFFTQGANFYDYPYGTCNGCNGLLEYYSPNVPTPREGYAVEGQRGLFTYAASDAVGIGRTDTAMAVNYLSPDQRNGVSVQRLSADFSGVHDDVSGFKLSHDDLTHFTEYVRYANDSGTNVIDGTQAQRYEAGASYYTTTSSINAAIRKIGAYFSPVDGIIQHPDIAGYDLNASKAVKYAPTAPITEIDVNANVDRYHAHAGELDQSDTSLGLIVSTRTLFNLQLSTGSSYLLLAPGLFSPVNQQGVQLGYDLNSNTPTLASYNTGRFGPGRLDTWTRSTTMRFTPRGLLSFEVDDTDQFGDRGARYTEWLERASFGYQTSATQSFALGVRRVIGTPPQLVNTPPFQSAWNLSAAFHRRFRGGEVYAAYGDAAAFSTAPQFLLKLIRYVGAEKGT